MVFLGGAPVSIQIASIAQNNNNNNNDDNNNVASHGPRWTPSSPCQATPWVGSGVSSLSAGLFSKRFDPLKTGMESSPGWRQLVAPRLLYSK